MQKIKLLGVYKWATMGGVERVLLNRAHAIKENNINMQYDVYFNHDSGGKKEFTQYLRKNNLQDIMNVVEVVDNTAYDYILSIDTPEIVELVDPQKLYLECHTSYAKYRSYLKKLPANIKGILVPSEQFKNEIKEEIPQCFMDRIQVIPNTVHINQKTIVQEEGFFNKTPVLYLGRLDKLKNVEELLKIISYYNKCEDRLFLVLAGAIIEHEFDLQKMLEEYNMIHRTIYLPPLGFDKTSELLSIIKDNKGIFMSASLKESFGLSVAEAMLFGVPVLILNNSAHISLVNGNDNFLFNHEDVDQTSLKLKNIIENYNSCSQIVQEYGHSINNDFITSWRDLFEL